MHNKYKLPLQLFIILEKINPIIYTSEILIPNHFIIYLAKNNFITLNYILKHEFFCSKSTLIENSCVDTLNYSNVNIPVFNKTRLLPFYLYYIYNLKSRLTLILHLDSQTNNVSSIDLLYKNANWLERESSEMYGIFYKNKKDSRKLLLDYTKDENPLLKDFPTEGSNDIFYNFFEDQVSFEKNNVVEL